MSFRGKVQGGVVVLENGVQLPEGAEVLVLARGETSRKGTPGKPIPVGDRMLELAEWAEAQPTSLPEDLAANHDHYLHGLPKRQ